MIDVELDEDMDMPVPCQRCHDWFDLNDGFGSIKWFPNIVICGKCHEIEVEEVADDEEYEDIKQVIADAEYEIREASKRLEVLLAKKGKVAQEKVILAKFTTDL